MESKPKFWIRAVSSAAGAALVGPGGAVLGALAGGLVATIVPGLPDFLGDAIKELTTGTARSLGESLTNQLDQGQRSRINHDLQVAFREAFRRALYDIGGKPCFPRAWKSARLDNHTARRVVYPLQPEAHRLWQEENPLAQQICQCMRKLEQALDGEELLSLKTQPDQPAASVLLYLEAETSYAMADAFFDQVVASHLESTLRQDWPGFEAHLRRHLLDRTLVHLGEWLKDPQHTSAWRAFNRMMLEGLRDELRRLGASQTQILSRLDALLTQPGGQMLADWTQGLADLLAVTGRIEKQVNESLDAVLGRVVAQHGEVLARMDHLAAVAKRTEGKVDRTLDELVALRHVIRSSDVGVSGLHLPDRQPLIVPPLPASFLERTEELDRLRELVLNPREDRGMDFTAIYGLGGTGKSVLATALCHDPDVQEAFPDGLFWVPLGRNVGNLVGQMQAIGVPLGDHPSYYTTPEGSLSRLSEILASRAVLIVLDDVWDPQHVEKLHFHAPRCHIVLTTRIWDIASSAGAATLKLDVLKPSDAVELLRRISGSEAPELIEIAECLGCLPLALTLAGKRLQEGLTATSWLSRYREHVMELRLDRRSIRPQDNLEACFDLSTEQFPQKERLLYYSLGIFPEDVWVPQRVVLLFWHQLASYEDYEFSELLESLAHLALIDISDEAVSLHDLLHSYNKYKLEKQNMLAEYQSVLLKAYNPNNKPWYKIDHDGYLYHYLSYHMMNANREDELFHLLRATTKWMERKLDEPNLALESLVVNIWHCYREKHREKARTFLTKRWLSRGIPWRRQAGYTAKVIAVRCAFEAGYDDGLAIALCHSDTRLRSAAMTYTYYLSQQKSEEETQRALSILKAVGSRVAGSVFPSIAALQSVFLLAPLLAIDQFQAGDLDTPVVSEIVSVLHGSIRSITDRSLVRMLGTRARILAVRAGVRIIVGLLQAAESSSVNDLRGVSLFFEQPDEVRSKTRGVLVYLDRTYSSPEDASGRILEIANKLSDLDRISGLVADYALYGRAIHDPTMAKDLLEQVARKDDPSCFSYLFASHLYYSVMVRQPDAAITDAALETMRAFVTKWLDSGRHGYGRVQYKHHTVQFYPLAFYAALWTKSHRGEQVDLLDMYANRAAREDDQAMKLHIIASFGDFRQILYDYPTALQILTPYIQEVASKISEQPDRAQENPIRVQLVQSLGALRGLRPAQVDAFLHEIEAPPDLVNDIRAYSYQKPFVELFFRMYQILADVVAYAPVEFVREIIRILDRALATRSIDEMAATLVDELIALAETSRGG